MFSEQNTFGEERCADNNTSAMGVPVEFACSLCKQLLRDAVLAVCCGRNFCAECARGHLLSNGSCPNAGGLQSWVGRVVPNVLLRAGVGDIRKALAPSGTNAASTSSGLRIAATSGSAASGSQKEDAGGPMSKAAETIAGEDGKGFVLMKTLCIKQKAGTSSPPAAVGDDATTTVLTDQPLKQEIEAASASEVNNSEAHGTEVLSKVVDMNRIFPVVLDRTPGCYLRPVFIDGPSVARSYDKTYDYKAIKDNGFVMGNASRFPVRALLAISFNFLARGHKVFVFMPSFYLDGNPMQFASRRSEFDLSSAVDMDSSFRRLIELCMVHFVSEKENFVEYIQAMVVSCQGILVTGVLYGFEPGLSCQYKLTTAGGEEVARDVSAATRPQIVEELKSQLFSENAQKNRPLMALPIFYGAERSLCIPTDLSMLDGSLPGLEDVLVCDAEKVKNSGMLQHQISLIEQIVQLKEISDMLGSSLPRGAKDERVLNALVYAADAAGVEVDIEVW